MPKKVKPVPEGYHTVTPHLVVNGAAKAIEFYKKAFGAAETHPPCMDGGRIMHAEIKIGGSIVMLGDSNPEMKCGPTSSMLYLYVEDCDKVFNQALKAGAKVEQPLQEMFWGDRYGCVTDPWGNKWGVATHKEDLTPQEMAKRQEEFMSALARN